MGRKLTPRRSNKVARNRSYKKKYRKKYTRKKNTRKKNTRKKKHSKKHRNAGLGRSHTSFEKCLRACNAIWRHKGSKKHTDCSLKCSINQDRQDEIQIKQLLEDKQRAPVVHTSTKNVLSDQKTIRGKWYFWDSDTLKYMNLTNKTTVFGRIMDRIGTTKQQSLQAYIEQLANKGIYNVGIPIKYDRKRRDLNGNTGMLIGNIAFIKPTTALPDAMSRLAFASALSGRLGIDSKLLKNIPYQLYSRVSGVVEHKGRAYIGELQLIDPDGPDGDTWTPPIQIIFADPLPPIKQIVEEVDAVNWYGTEIPELIKERQLMKS